LYFRRVISAKLLTNGAFCGILIGR